MNTKFILKLILVATLLPFISLAANVAIEFEKTPSLFSESNFMPGDSVSRWIKIQNIGSENKIVATKALNFANPTPNNDLSRALLITIKKDGTDFYGGSLGQKTLFDFYQQGLVDLANIAPGQAHQYDYIISFPTEKENEWQGKQTYFDIQIGYKDGSQDPEDPEDPDTHGGGGGGNGGGCTNMIFAGSVKSQDITQTSANIIWKTTCLTDSEVVYSDNDDEVNFSKSKTNYGYDNSTGVEKKLVDDHKMALNNLKPCTKYYYRVASKDMLAVSGQNEFTTLCPEDISTNDYRGPGGEQGTVAGVSIKAEEPKPEVKGLQDFIDNFTAKIPGTCSNNDILPWILMIIAGIMSFIENKAKRDLAKILKQSNIRI